MQEADYEEKRMGEDVVTLRKFSQEFGRWSDGSKAVFIGLMLVLSISCAFHFIPEREAGERVPMIVDNTTGAQVCPFIVGCDVRPSQVEGWCYFREDC